MANVVNSFSQVNKSKESNKSFKNFITKEGQANVISIIFSESRLKIMKNLVFLLTNGQLV